MLPNFNPAQFFSLLIALVVGLSFHEFGHAAMATKLGDPTPRLQGRLTLNPLAHIDRVGAFLILFMSFVGFGFAYGKPVQTNPAYYPNYRRGTILVSIAGPAMNLCLAMLAVAAGYILFLAKIDPGEFIHLLLFIFIYVNVILMVFNLFPIPPLDGGHVLEQMLPWDKRTIVRQMAGFGLVILLVLWFTGILGRIISFIFTVILFLIQLGFGAEYVEFLFSGLGL